MRCPAMGLWDLEAMRVAHETAGVSLQKVSACACPWLVTCGSTIACNHPAISTSELVTRS
jgi:hypothetical protein